MGLRTCHFASMMKSACIAVVAMCVLFLFPNAAALAQQVNVAGLIVDYGDGRVSYAVVPFEEDVINGLDLLHRSGLDVVTVGFGGLGDAVCQVEDTGCPVDDCRKRMCQTSDPESPFWQFSKLGGDGEWLFVATGASGAKVNDGDIYAWSWVGTTPTLPVMTIDELTERAGGEPGGSGNLQAFLRTEGDSPGNDDSGTGMIAIGAIGVVMVAAIFLVLRSRLPRADEQGTDER